MEMKRGRVVPVTVASKLPEFKDKMILKKLVDKSVSWDVFLRNYGITLNDEKYCISGCGGRVMATTKDKVSKVIDQYVRKRTEYKVWIVENITRDTDQQGHEEEAMGQRTSSRKRKPTKRLVEEEPVDQGDVFMERAVDNATFEFPMPQARPPAIPYNPVRRWVDSVGNVSTVSQDSFDAGSDESIKEVIIEKLRHWATNGDLHRLRHELQTLKASRKHLKVARYIPYTMNVLGVIFETN